MQRQDYPRPDAVRPRIRLLNGEWEFSLDEADFGKALPGALPCRIKVPFPAGSEMSGQTERAISVCYLKSFDLSAFECAGTVLLNFLNVDGAFTALLNGIAVYSGTGGEGSFHFDVSALVKPGQNVLTVYCAASPFTRGICGHVWLEFAAKSYFSFLRANAVYASKAVYIQGSIAGETDDHKILVEIAANGKQIYRREYKALPSFTLHAPLERLPDMWTASHPALYDVRVTLITPGGGMADMIYTYTAFREIDVVDGRLYINGRKTFLESVRDRLYYPGSDSTPPSSKRIAEDLAYAVLAGFNTVTFCGYPTPAHLYIADKLGLFVIIVLKDLSSSDNKYTDLIMRDYGHPSIIMWEPVAEEYGAAEQNLIYASLKNLDPKRLVVFPSAKRIYKSDMYCFDCAAKDIPMYLQLRFNRVPLSEREELRLKKSDPAAPGTAELGKLPAFYTGLTADLDRGDAVKEARFKAAYAAVIAALAESASGLEAASLYDTPDIRDGLMNAERESKQVRPQLKQQ